MKPKQARITKVIGRQRLKAIGLPNRIEYLCRGNNGACYSSIVIGILFDNKDEDIKAGMFKWKQGIGKEASEKQVKAVLRVIYGRHYSKEALDRLDMFLASPLEYAKEHFEADKIRVIRCINVNEVKRLEALEKERQVDIEAGIPARMTAPELTEEQKALLDISF